MRKATGKVVSLVLALALVITSFSATFASAASTKTESAEFVGEIGNVTLVNLSDGENTTEVNELKSANKDKFNLTDWINDEANSLELESYDHISITDLEIQSISISGDNVISVAKATAAQVAAEGALYNFADEGDYVATLRSATGTGTATVKVLLTGESTDRGDDTITFRGTASFTVEVVDIETPYLDSINNLERNPSEGTSVTSTGYFKKPVRGENGAQAGTPEAMAVVAYEDGSDDEDPTKDGIYEDPVEDESDEFYIVQVVGTDGQLTMGGDNKEFTYGIDEPTVGKSVRVRVYAPKNTGTQEEPVWELGSALETVTVKVEDKLVATGALSIALGNGDKDQTVDNSANKVLSKSKTYVMIGESYWTVNSATSITTDGAIDVESGRMGNLSGAAITVTDGTIGDITASGDVTINGGVVGDIDANANDVTVFGGTVASVSEAANVTVSDGKISGSVSATGIVTVSPANNECTASVGAVSAPQLYVDSTEAAASVASFFAADAGEGDYLLTLTGSASTIGAIDADYRDLEVYLNDFAGTISAPSNARNTGYDLTGAKISTNVDSDTVATVTGNVVIEDIALEGGSVTFTGSVTVDNVSGGEADLVVNAGALYVKESVATGNTLKIANATDVKAGTLVFRAASDIAAVDSFLTYGYELDVVSSTSYDGFVIKSISFAGLTLDCGDTIELLVDEEVTVTASAYPAGTELPEGLEIMFYLNDADLNYITGTNLGDGKATVKALKYDSEFDVLNTATLQAVVVDEYEMVYEEYGQATATVKVVESKAPTATYASDTTGDVVVASGNTYQFKITSLNGQAPSVVLGTDGIFELVSTVQEGNDYFFKFQAVGASGAATGVYVNGDAKVATLYVDANTGYTCDTTTVNVPVGGTYQVKITASSMPTLVPGNSIYTVAFASQEGNDYFFKITATSAQAGDVVGFYINGGARAFVATTV